MLRYFSNEIFSRNMLRYHEVIFQNILINDTIQAICKIVIILHVLEEMTLHAMCILTLHAIYYPYTYGTNVIICT